ncbi:hypothetical protein GCM10010176_028560 [Nonomuraea spiralis]|nr:hypothetical protein GCM10010176_028560 [Nonomuraea spiralis]
MTAPTANRFIAATTSANDAYAGTAMATRPMTSLTSIDMTFPLTFILQSPAPEPGRVPRRRVDVRTPAGRGGRSRPAGVAGTGDRSIVTAVIRRRTGPLRGWGSLAPRRVSSLILGGGRARA